VRAMQDHPRYPKETFRTWTCGSECDGGFAQYTVQRASQICPLVSDWSDAELASIPCAYSTAESMLHRAQVGRERVLITGASGAVGSAAVQLAKRRGATVIAVCSSGKMEQILELGADRVIDRSAGLLAELGPDAIDVILDVVAGRSWGCLLDLLRPVGKYVVSGAIAGPIVNLDLRTLYLKDLTLYGATAQPPEVFSNLVRYVETNSIRPVVAKIYPLEQIH